MFAPSTRRTFLQSLGGGAAALGLPAFAAAEETPIPGFERTPTDPQASRNWKPVSDRKIRVGIVGYGACKFGAEFGFQDHPNVSVVAVSDLFPDRCAALAEACRCSKTYPSLEELIADDTIEAVFLATDAPSHAQHAIQSLQKGKHVACAVPAVYGSLEDAERLLEAVKTSDRRYMMFETSYFHEDLYAMREIYRAGGFGKLMYAEGEYYHFVATPTPSYKEWRVGPPPLWYPTHATAYYVGVTGGHFTEVSGMGMPSKLDHFQPANNRYKNPFGSEFALLRTSDGGAARMLVSIDSIGPFRESGRVRGQLGSFDGKYEGQIKLPQTDRPPLPPGLAAGGHGGSHGHLTNEFVTAILQDRHPWCNVAEALNMTVPGVIAHQSAMKNGELLQIPKYTL